MLLLGAGTPSNRERRQAIDPQRDSRSSPHVNSNYGYAAAQPVVCKCEAANNCPAGPAGPPGAQGEAGVAGIGGKPGIPGEDAPDWQNAPFKGCIVSFMKTFRNYH